MSTIDAETRTPRHPTRVPQDLERNNPVASTHTRRSAGRNARRTPRAGGIMFALAAALTLTGLTAGTAHAAAATSTDSQTTSVRPYADRPAIVSTFKVPAPGTDTGWKAVDHTTSAGVIFTAWRLNGAGDFTITATTLHGTTNTLGTVAGTGYSRITLAGGTNRVFFALVNDTRTGSSGTPLVSTDATVGTLTPGSTATTTTFPDTSAGAGTYTNQTLFGAGTGTRAALVQHVYGASDTDPTQTRVYVFDGTTWTKDTTGPAFQGLSTIPDVAVSDAGQVALTWPQWPTDPRSAYGATYQTTVRATTGATGATWSTPQTLGTARVTSPVFDIDLPHGVWNPDGTLDVLWRQGTRTAGDPANGIRTRTWTNGSWGTAHAETVTDSTGTVIDIGAAAPTTGARETFGATEITWTHPSSGETITGRLLGIEGRRYFRPAGTTTFTEWPTGSDGAPGYGFTTGGLVVDGPHAWFAAGDVISNVVGFAPDVYAPDLTVVDNVDGNQVSVTASDDTTVAVTGCALSYTPEGGVAASSPNTTTSGITCAWNASAGTPDGTYQLTSAFTDAVGNTATDVHTWTLDRVTTTDPGGTDPGTGGTNPGTDPGTGTGGGGSTPVPPSIAAGSAGTTTLAPNAATATFSFPSDAGPGAVWTFTTTSYAPTGATTDRRVTTATSGTYTTGVPDGAEVCVSARVTATNGLSSPASDPVCRTGRLDVRNRAVVVRGNVRHVASTAAHGHSVAYLRGALGAKKAAKVRLRVAAGAVIRLQATGAGKAVVTIPGARPVTLRGKKAAVRTFRATRAGTVVIAHAGGTRKAKKAPFVLDSFTITTR